MLCAVSGKKDVKRRISAIDALDFSIITYKELLNSVNALLCGGMIYEKKNKFKLTDTAKRILKGKLFTGGTEWQPEVQKRITEYSCEEGENVYFFSEEEYEKALNSYIEQTEKFIARFTRKP